MKSTEINLSTPQSIFYSGYTVTSVSAFPEISQNWESDNFKVSGNLGDSFMYYKRDSYKVLEPLNQPIW